MNHENYKELLDLNILGELNQQEEIDLQNHLFECKECNEEYVIMKKMYSLVSTERPKQPTDNDLVNARIRLFNTINSEDKNEKAKSWINEYWDLLISSKYKLALSSITLVLVGLFIGYFLFSTSNSSKILFADNEIDLDKIERGELKIADISLPAKFSKNNEFKFVIGEANPITYEGNINDIIIQKLLASSIQQTENPGYKIKAVNKIADLVSENFIPDQKIKEAFIQTIKKDNNPGVRKGALKALLNFPYDNQIRDAMLYILNNDENASNRMSAISALLAMKFNEFPIDDSSRLNIEKFLSNEDNQVIKYKTAKYLLGGN